MDTSTSEIAQLVGGTLVGDGAVRITGINSIRQARIGDLTFLSDRRYNQYLETTGASAVLVTRNVSKACRPIIQVDDPYGAMQQVLELDAAQPLSAGPGIHPTAIIDSTAQIAENTTIGAHAVIGPGAQIESGSTIHAGVFIGDGTKIGADALIYPNVTIRERITLGDRCIIHPGAVIGADGFGFNHVNGCHEKIPQTGTVRIGDDVEIGANTAIDRATFGETVIGTGTKVDNFVQIGHNCEIGNHCIVCGNAGIAGSTIIADHVVVGAGAGVSGHLEIGAGAMIGGYSGVTRSLKPGEIVFGYPAVELGRSKRMHAALRQLPDALKRLRALEQRTAKPEGDE